MMPLADPNRIIARFGDRAAATAAMKRVVGPDLGRRAEMLPAPSGSRRFDRRRVVWGVTGGLAGLVAGALVTGAIAHLITIDQGLLVVGGPAGGVLLAALLGGALLGTLGLLAGLAIGETKGTHEATLDPAPPSAAVFVRVELPWGARDDGSRDRRIRASLREAGGRLVATDSRATRPDVTPLATIPPEPPSAPARA